jgi:hypothetical protein
MMGVLETLSVLWQFDIWVFSQWWLYAPLFIPFFFYMMFFMLKWVILTLPVWMPVCIVLGAAQNKNKEKTK